MTLEGTNTWVVGTGPALVIDPGPDYEDHLEAVRAEAGAVGAILLTHRHPDHAPGAAPLAAATGAGVYAWRPEPEESGLRPGQEFTSGDGAHSPEEIVPAVYGGYAAELHALAARSVLAHLLKLEREGRAARVGPPRDNRFEVSTPADCRRCGRPAMPRSTLCRRCSTELLQEAPTSENDQRAST